MGLYKRKGSDNWHIRISHNGREIRKTTGTVDKKKAQRVHDELKAKLWNLKYTGDRPEYKWEDAVTRFLETKEKQVTDDEILRMVKFVHPYFGGLSLRNIDSDLVHRVVSKRRKEVKGSTANKTVTHIRRIFRAAKKWGWIDGIPDFPTYKEESRELALNAKEAELFINLLPPYMANMCGFSLATGLRRHNVTHLKWQHYKKEKKELFIPANETKNDEPLIIPLNKQARYILKQQQDLDKVWVFPSPVRKGRPMKYVVNKSFKNARDNLVVITKNKELKKLNFHTLRHTWATWHIQTGTDPMTLQKLGGWNDQRSMKRYINLSSDHLHKMAKNIEKPHKTRTVPETIDHENEE